MKVIKYFLALACAVGFSASAQSVNGVSGQSVTATQSSTVKYISQLGCAAQNASFDTRSGTDDTACINSFLATATPTHRVVLIQDPDKVSAIGSTAAVAGPTIGNWEIDGSGGGWATVQITNCTISSGVASFVTKPQTLTAGKVVVVGGFGSCSALNNTRVTVNSSGLTSIGFTVNTGAADVASSSENAVASYLSGSGFVILNPSAHNGIVIGAEDCGYDPSVARRHGSNVALRNFVIDGNYDGQVTGTWCQNIVMQGVDDLVVDGITSFAPASYNLTISDDNLPRITNSNFLATFPGIAPQFVNKDGVHVGGSVTNLYLSNDYFHTDDDPIALNANEQFCGTISGVYATNINIDDSDTMFRLDSGAGTCFANVQHVYLDNYSGSVYSLIGFIGNTAQPTHAASGQVEDFRWSNSTVVGRAGFNLVDDLGSLNLENVKWIVSGNDGGASGAWFDVNNAAMTAREITFRNVTEQGTAANHPSTWYGLARQTGGSSALTVDKLTLDGFSLTCDSATASDCGLPLSSFIASSQSGIASISKMQIGVFDSANVGALDASGKIAAYSGAFPTLVATPSGKVMIGNAGGGSYNSLTFNGSLLDGQRTGFVVDGNAGFGGDSILYYDSPFDHEFRVAGSTVLDVGTATAPTGSCSGSAYNLTRDGHMSWCNGSSWVQKF